MWCPHSFFDECGHRFFVDFAGKRDMLKEKRLWEETLCSTKSLRSFLYWMKREI